MAQKIFPRSLRSTKLLSPDFSFYGEETYSKVWIKGYQIANALLSFSQKNLLYKKKTRGGKKPGKKKKIPSFLYVRSCASNLAGTFSYSPVLFKFPHLSLSKKYNPIKALRKKRFMFKKPWKKKVLSKRKSFSFFKKSIFLIFNYFSNFFVFLLVMLSLNKGFYVCL